jgi:hypothetical protein
MKAGIMKRGSGFGTRNSRRLLWLLCALTLTLALGGAGLLAGCQASDATTTTLAATPTTTATVAGATTTSSASSTSSTTTTTEMTTTTTELTPPPTEATTTTTIPADPKGWKRFAAGGVSIALPTSFKGGEPTSAAFKAQVKRMVNSKTWLSNMQSFYTDGDETWLLGMFGNSSKTRWIPMVLASRALLPAGFSLSDYTAEWLPYGIDGYVVDVIDEKADRASYLITEPKVGSDPAGARIAVFIKSGDYVYTVEYSGTKVAFAQFESAYKQSAARIIVSPPAATSTTGATGTTTTTTSTGTI